MELNLHAFLTSVPDGNKWLASRPGCFTVEERASGIHWQAAGGGEGGGMHSQSGYGGKEKIPNRDRIRTEVVHPATSHRTKMMLESEIFQTGIMKNCKVVDQISKIWNSEAENESNLF
jgi:hypothetical protein